MAETSLGSAPCVIFVNVPIILNGPSMRKSILKICMVSGMAFDF